MLLQLIDLCKVQAIELQAMGSNLGYCFLFEGAGPSQNTHELSPETEMSIVPARN